MKAIPQTAIHNQYEAGDTPVSREGIEHRLAAILSADVVGYSRLMAADEAGTFAQLKTLRKELIEPKTAEYGNTES